jgi:hypothetical protein
MFKVAEKLYVAGCRECSQKRAPGTTYIYCCQWPCGQSRAQAVSPTCPAASGNPRQNFIRLVNTEIPNYRPEEFNQYLDLLDQHLNSGEVVLVSEQGESRAPSLALLWMVFRGRYLSKSCFAAARSDFSRIYPHYLPWPGWIIFFEQEWDAFH